MSPRVVSYGGGLDSFAMLVEGLQRGELRRGDVVVFVNVADAAGADPGEWPGTYRHLDQVVRPLCERHGLELVVIDDRTYPVRDARSLFAWLQARGQIPVAGPSRICTRIAKVERFEAWMHDRFAGEVVEVWIGFEAGEDARVASDPNAGTAGDRARRAFEAEPWRVALRRNRFPLMEWSLCRCRCEALVRAAGHPVPRKSACVFCPYGSRGDWQRFAVELPEMFAEVEQLEARKLATPTKRGRSLSIMGYDSKRQRPTPLRQFIGRPYTRKVIGCKVCGAPQRATKATACGYLDDQAAA